MEEWVGEAWHRIITRAARTDFPAERVSLEDIKTKAAVLFRALGGDGGLRLEAANETRHGARRQLFGRLAGSERNVELAWRDGETLRLPLNLSCLPSRALNRELYLWLAALAAWQPTVVFPDDSAAWLRNNALATARLLNQYHGLTGRYRRLSEAHLDLRPDPAKLPSAEAAQEFAIREALRKPENALGISWPEGEVRHRPAPVPLWLHPDPPGVQRVRLPRDESGEESSGQDNKSQELEADKRRRGEYVDEPDSKGGLLAFRLESLFTRAEYVAVDRTQEENEDEDAKSSVEDLDVLSMSQSRARKGARLRFDLDLPSPEYDDACLADGIALPEWDYRKQFLQADHCRLQIMQSRDLDDTNLPAHLAPRARKLRAQFELLRPRRVWQAGQPDGSELDTNALIRQATDRQLGRASSDQNLFRNFRNLERDLCCLVLADLSLSTDAHVNDKSRVIDVIRDSLHLFSEALGGSSDRYALYGFSSRYREHVRLHEIKTFDETACATVRARINAIKPGYYTRMGAAIRYATQQLERESSAQKLLLLLTDGKPNDLDQYEGRYGVEDTREALRAAQRSGIQPFCVTIDQKARDYLPYLFGSSSYVLVRNATELPLKLPALYARLTS